MATNEVYNEQVVDTIEMTESVKIIFYYDYFNDKVWANIRKFIKSKKYTGPTKQGIKFDPAKLPEIKKAFDEANNQGNTIQDEEFLRIPRSPNRELVVHASVYKGSLGVDLRIWLNTEKYKGWTKDGIRFPINIIPRVLEALQKMIETKPTLEEKSGQTKLKEQGESKKPHDSSSST
ncbi:MAG: hypothetical protein WBB67_09490 [bacterium]